MCQVLGIQIGIGYILGFKYLPGSEENGLLNIGCDKPVACSIIDVCIRPPDEKIMNLQCRPAVVLDPQLSCATGRPLGSLEAMGLQGLMNSL